MFRTIAFTLLAFAVLARSFVAVGGEVHEAGHIVFADHVAAVAHDHDGHPDDSEPQTAWHKLLHATHCCGHAVAIPPTMLPAAAAPADADRVLMPADSFSSRSRRPLHRPPISV